MNSGFQSVKFQQRYTKRRLSRSKYKNFHVSSWHIFNTLFLTDFHQFSKRGLLFKHWLIRDLKWPFFMLWSNFRILLSNPSQIFKINAMIIFYALLNMYWLFLTHSVYPWQVSSSSDMRYPSYKECHFKTFQANFGVSWLILRWLHCLHWEISVHTEINFHQSKVR